MSTSHNTAVEDLRPQRELLSKIFPIFHRSSSDPTRRPGHVRLTHSHDELSLRLEGGEVGGASSPSDVEEIRIPIQALSNLRPKDFSVENSSLKHLVGGPTGGAAAGGRDGSKEASSGESEVLVAAMSSQSAQFDQTVAILTFQEQVSSTNNNTSTPIAARNAAPTLAPTFLRLFMSIVSKVHVHLSWKNRNIQGTSDESQGKCNIRRTLQIFIISPTCMSTRTTSLTLTGIQRSLQFAGQETRDIWFFGLKDLITERNLTRSRGTRKNPTAQPISVDDVRLQEPETKDTDYYCKVIVTGRGPATDGTRPDGTRPIREHVLTLYKKGTSLRSWIDERLWSEVMEFLEAHGIIPSEGLPLYIKAQHLDWGHHLGWGHHLDWKGRPLLERTNERGK
ncbi:unnamed protein product [Amoebophrya sp. A25]|nr:unnamed protein product [Amoebophrya sp. A25]|eukprot:GSA25T00009547001.1